MDDSIRGKFSGSKLTKKNFLAGVGVISLLLMTVGGVVAQSSGTNSVELGNNGIFVNQGTLDMKGNDIESSGTTIWDGSAGQIATAVVDYSAVTASDVGLGNVLDKEQLAVDGSNSMNDNLNMNIESINDVKNINFDQVLASSGNINNLNSINFDDSLGKIDSSPADNSTSSDDLYIESQGSFVVNATPDDSGSQVILSAGSNTCYIDPFGDWNCEGGKNWVHDINSTHDAFYTSQESPEVRAVYEGKAHLDNKKKIELPYHFSKTVSDSKPMLRATATVQGKLAYAAVIEKTDDYIVLESSKEADVNYRITGIREGYEDKDVVRPSRE